MKEKNIHIQRLEKEIDELNRIKRILSSKQITRHASQRNEFKCDQCDEVFQDRNGLIMHLKVHQESIPQIDGMDSSIMEGSVDKNPPQENYKSDALSRLKMLTASIDNYQTPFR